MFSQDFCVNKMPCFAEKNIISGDFFSCFLIKHNIFTLKSPFYTVTTNSSGNYSNCSKCFDLVYGSYHSD